MMPTLGLPALSIAPAIGIALVVSYLTYQDIDCQPQEKGIGEKIASYLALAIFRPLFVLFFGLIVHLYM